MNQFFGIRRHAIALASVSSTALPVGGMVKGKRSWLARLFGVSSAKLSSWKAPKSPLSRTDGCMTTSNRPIAKRWPSFAAFFRPDFSAAGSHAKKSASTAGSGAEADLPVTVAPLSHDVVRDTIPAMRIHDFAGCEDGRYTAHQIFAMVNFTAEAQAERNARIADPQREIRDAAFRRGYF